MTGGGKLVPDHFAGTNDSDRDIHVSGSVALIHINTQFIQQLRAVAVAQLLQPIRKLIHNALMRMLTGAATVSDNAAEWRRCSWIRQYQQLLQLIATVDAQQQQQQPL